MLRIAITGGLCGGKSTVAAMFRDLGWPVVDADALGHALLRTGGEAVDAVLAAFGSGLRDPAGGVDRARLAALVFGAGNEDARLRLNAILHPRIVAATDAQFARWAAAGHPLAAAEAALFIETGLHRRFDRVILVTCDPEQRLLRCAARGTTRPQALARMAAQWPDAEKAKLADFIVDNSGALPATRAQVENIARQVSETCDSDKASPSV